MEKLPIWQVSEADFVQGRDKRIQLLSIYFCV